MSVMGRSLPPVASSIQKRLFATISLIVFITGTAIVALPGQASAVVGQIGDRSLTLQNGTYDSNGDGINDGGSRPGGRVGHLFSLEFENTQDVGSIKFEYCTTASGTCTAPAGLSLTTPGATLGSPSSPGITFNSIDNDAANVTIVSRATTFNVSSVPLTVRVELLNVVNPSAPNETFYVRTTAYASTDGTGAAGDVGTVAASTANAIVVSGTMPESLIFCAGAAITMNGSIPDCTSASTGIVNFNQLFSPSSTATATSDLAASTNALSGYAITYSGPTLTNGSYTIAPLTAGGLSTVGTGQFGLNVIDNTGNATPFRPDVGQAINPASNTTNYKAAPYTGYGTDNTYKFTTAGDILARSDDGGAGPTDAQRITVSYIVNVSGSQVAGTYTSTITYVCTAMF